MQIPKEYRRKLFIAACTMIVILLGLFNFEWLKQILIYILECLPTVLKWGSILLIGYMTILYFFQNKLIYINYGILLL